MNRFPLLAKVERCSRCGAAGAADLCDACVGETPQPSSVVSSLIGRTLADRYEILALLADGGMGRVYRARQTSLGREVALKVIHPHLAGEASRVERFMREAQAASRINHPHVVSIFDFGRTAESDGGHLFLVMELLDGADLEAALRREPALPFSRVTAIVGQTLEALGEAHRLGITHRDVKPANIVLLQRRSGRDHVKVIDFGIAVAAHHGRITEHGVICGSPLYMAPEQASGAAVGAWTDIYSAGVVLFELLTGQPPFTGSPVGMLLQHMRAPRPDPRVVAPWRAIPDALAEACLTALAIDPADRFESAEAFTDALARAVSPTPLRGPSRWTSDSLPPPPAAPPAVIQGVPLHSRPEGPSLLAETLPQITVLDGGTSATQAPAPPRRLRPQGAESAPIGGRVRELGWARSLVTGHRGPPAIALWGRPGIGRTRLLEEIAEIADRAGALVVNVPLAPAPRNVVGYDALRAMIVALSGLTPADLFDVRIAGSTDRKAWTGLRALFDPTLNLYSMEPATLAAGTAAALSWAARSAVDRAPHGRVLLTLDDVELLDGASRLAVDELLRADPLPGFTVLVTGERPPTPAFADPGRVEARTLTGLRRADALQMLATLRPGAVLTRGDDDIEPLYVEQIARLRASYDAAAPARLDDLVASRVLGLPPVERRALQAVAVLGGGPTQAIVRLLGGPVGLDEAVKSLEKGGYVRVRDGAITLRHAIFGRAAITTAPSGAVAELHDAAAAQLAETAAPVELRAWHALRGRPDFHAFLLVETAARIRAARGDRAGVLASLTEAIEAARSLSLRGEVEVAATAWSNFGQKLAAALADERRYDEAQGVLAEVLEVPGLGEYDRVSVREQMMVIDHRRGRPRTKR